MGIPIPGHISKAKQQIFLVTYNGEDLKQTNVHLSTYRWSLLLAEIPG